MTSTWVSYVVYTSGLRHVKTGVQATDLYRVEDLPEGGLSSGTTVFETQMSYMIIYQLYIHSNTF
jgi:hypothetical protein